MSFRKFRFVLVSLFAIVTTGCATMFNGSSQTVFIRSTVSGTKLYLNQSLVGKNNAVSILKKNKNYVIKASKKGCDDAFVPVSKSFDPTTLLGLLVDWGLISILIVDGFATGAWHSFDQTSYVLDPDCG